MTNPHEIVQALSTLVADLESDLSRAERRVAAAVQARDALRDQIAAAQTTLAMYRDRHQLPEPETEDVEALRVQFASRPTKDIVVELARMRGGRIAITEVAPVLVRAGLFRDAPNASSNLHSAIHRLGHDVFQKVRPGVYQLIEVARETFVTDEHARADEEEAASPTDSQIASDDDPFQWLRQPQRNGFRHEPEAVGR